MTRSIAAASIAALVLCGSLGASAAAPVRHDIRGSRQVAWHGSVDYTHNYYSADRRGHGAYTDLVGDSYSGLGFYPLPRAYRAAATRYGEHRIATNAIRYAVASQALETPFFFPAGGNGYRYGVFNPNDGVGTPFFAGYYAAE